MIQTNLIESYQRLIEQLIKSNISFRVNTEHEKIEFNNDIYASVEVDLEDEAVNYCVGAGLRELDFNLEDVTAVINYIEKQLTISD